MTFRLLNNLSKTHFWKHVNNYNIFLQHLNVLKNCKQEVKYFIIVLQTINFVLTHHLLQFDLKIKFGFSCFFSYIRIFSVIQLRPNWRRYGFRTILCNVETFFALGKSRQESSFVRIPLLNLNLITLKTLTCMVEIVAEWQRAARLIISISITIGCVCENFCNTYLGRWVRETIIAAGMPYLKTIIVYVNSCYCNF